LSFLLIGREMLYSRRHAGRLHTKHILSGELASEVGILGEALKVTTTETSSYPPPPQRRETYERAIA